MGQDNLLLQITAAVSQHNAEMEATILQHINSLKHEQNSLKRAVSAPALPLCWSVACGRVAADGLLFLPFVVLAQLSRLQGELATLTQNSRGDRQGGRS